jgi:hypothetical protein
MALAPGRYRLLAVCVLSCSLAGCALHHSGQLKAPALGAVPPLRVAEIESGQGVFAPQLVSKVLEVWGVRGCPGAAVPIANIYEIAAAHGISYVEPDTAKTILATRTPLGIAIQFVGYAAGATALAMGVDWLKASIAWQRGLSVGSAVANWLLPALEKTAPPLLCTGQDLLVDSRGCGAVLFCSQPSAVGAFVEVLK